MESKEWANSRFGDCADLVRDTVNPSNANSSPYIGLEHIGEGTLSLIGIGSSDDVTSTKSRFQKGDILFGKLRPYFRKVIRAPFEGVCSTDIWVVRPRREIDPGFLFYWMASTDFVNASMRGSEGTKMPRAKWDFVSQIEKPLPPLPEQRAIAAVLGALDDKIELNRRMNRTLETMARALFKSWFVDFDPVRAKMEGRPTGLPGEIEALFVGEMEAGRPLGWEVTTLGTICEQPQYGYTASAEQNAVGPKFLRITDINKLPWIDWGTVPHCRSTTRDFEKYRLNQGDLVIARMADPGHGAYIENDVDAVFASYLIRFRPKLNEYGRYLQYWLFSPSYWDIVDGRKSGTTRANLNAQVLSAFPLLLPPIELASIFQRTIDDLRTQISANVNQSTTLAALRDALLPKLMSGEVRISHAENLFEVI